MENVNSRLRPTFKCDHMFPALKSLKDCDSVHEAWQRVYPHTLIELPLKAVIQTAEGEVSQPIAQHKAIIRSDGAEITTVRKSYTVVQPQTICDQFAPFVESGLVKLIAGGDLRGGTRISVMAQIVGSEREIVVGEQIAAFVNFYAGLDGTLGIGGGIFGVQARCLNGVCSLKSHLNLRLRHTKTVHLRLADVRESIAEAINAFNQSTQVYTQLAKRQVTRHAQETYVRRVILGADLSEQTEILSSDLSKEIKVGTRTENKVNRVIELLDTQRGLELVPAVRGTAWQAYSAVTEYITHEAGRNEDSRLNSRMFGENARLNSEALELARAM